MGVRVAFGLAERTVAPGELTRPDDELPAGARSELEPADGLPGTLAFPAGATCADRGIAP